MNALRSSAFLAGVHKLRGMTIIEINHNVMQIIFTRSKIYCTLRLRRLIFDSFFLIRCS